MGNKIGDNMGKQSIEFTSEQYFALMKAVYMGEWMANAHRTEGYKKEYEEIEDYIFSFAAKFDLEKWVDHEGTDKYYPTRAFEEETEELCDEYDEETVWDELAEWLGERDFFERYTESEINAMSSEDYFRNKSQCVAVYNKEFEQYGMERIRIIQ